MKNHKSTRDSYGETLKELAKKDKNVVALDCDLGRSTRSFRITEADPERFIEMGIAEQDMISTSAGMASMGKIVFANSFAVFLTGRAFDQIRQQVSLPSANVKLCASSAGLTQGPDGATHQSVLDVSLMRTLPNMIVLSPADGNQAEQVVSAAYEYKGPVYLRLSRYETGDFLPENLSFKIGKAQVLKEGKDVMLASYGPILKNVLGASVILENWGISTGVVNFHTIKPIDVETVKSLGKSYSLIVSIEEHSIIGGLGTALSEVLAEMNSEKTIASLKRIGVQDRFGESGTADELLKKFKLDADGIAQTIKELV